MITPPLYVDLDGTLISARTSRLCLQRLLVERPWLLPAAGLRLLEGRAAGKDFLGRAAPPDPAELIAYCREHLATYKCPRTIEIVDTVSSVPSR